jgi:hypothetical protein
LEGTDAQANLLLGIKLKFKLIKEVAILVKDEQKIFHFLTA